MSQPHDTLISPCFCRGCFYELSGLAAGKCPECARDFDPAEKGSVLPRKPSFLVANRLRRYTLLFTIALMVAGAMYLTLIPRPYVRWDGSLNWRVWLWLDQPYGVQRVPGMRTVDVLWWGGEVSRVSAYEPVTSPDGSVTFKPAWSVRRIGDDAWAMKVHAGGIPMGELLTAFNTLRDNTELFGVALVDGSPGGNAEPFEAEGPKEAVLTAIVHAYDVRVVPFLLSPEDTDVWVYDEDKEQAVLLSVEDAEQQGYDIQQPRIWSVNRHTWR
ncbi:MAG: RING finger protein [Planctomycetota bacterium]